MINPEDAAMSSCEEDYLTEPECPACDTQEGEDS